MTHTAACDRFIASMKIGYMEWHEGVPYDLGTLASVSPEELAELEALLVQRKDADWRDAEALATIKSPTAIRALQESLNGPNPKVRIRADDLLYEIDRLRPGRSSSTTA